jgi:hypothetical protein
MIKLKPLVEQTLLREYVDTDIVKLWKYLDGTLDTTFGKFGRFGEVARKIGYQNMMEFFIENADDTWWGSYDFSDDGTLGTTLMRYSTFKELETKKKGVYKLVLKWYEDVFNNKPGYIQELYSFYGGGAVNMPSWIFLKKPELVKNQWLVHGTTEDDVDSIKRQGFIKGVKDFKKLGLTTFWDGESAQKSAGGYNFAFTVSDFDEYGMDSGEPVYGDGTILVFRASGIRSYHISDSQWQTIFNGKTATDIVPIYSMMGSYVIYSQDGKKLFMTSAQGKSEAIDAVNWVVDNYDQYRKSIGWKKPR